MAPAGATNATSWQIMPSTTGMFDAVGETPIDPDALDTYREFTHGISQVLQKYEAAMREMVVRFEILDKEKARAFCEACYRNATELIAALCTEYGWDPDTALLTHGEITKNKLSDTTHADPEHLWNGLGLPYSLNTLKRDVKAAMQESSGSIPTKQTKPDPAKAFDKRLAGSYTVTASALNVRSGAGTDKAILTVLPNGTTVRNYGYYTEKNGTWLYVAFTQNGTPMEGYCFAQYLMRR